MKWYVSMGQDRQNSKCLDKERNSSQENAKIDKMPLHANKNKFLRTLSPWFFIQSAHSSNLLQLLNLHLSEFIVGHLFVQGRCLRYRSNQAVFWVTCWVTWRLMLQWRTLRRVPRILVSVNVLLFRATGTAIIWLSYAHVLYSRYWKRPWENVLKLHSHQTPLKHLQCI